MNSTSITKLMGGDTPPSTIEAERAENNHRKQSEDAHPGSPKDSGVDDYLVNTEEEEPDDGGDGWKFNLAMVLISFYVGMQLTNWYVLRNNIPAHRLENKRAEFILFTVVIYLLGVLHRMPQLLLKMKLKETMWTPKMDMLQCISRWPHNGFAFSFTM